MLAALLELIRIKLYYKIFWHDVVYYADCVVAGCLPVCLSHVGIVLNR